MTTYLITLRILHILGGAFWAGSAFMLAGYIIPTVQRSGPDGTKFIQTLISKTRFLTVISAASGICVLSGLLLYWRLAGNRLNFDWMVGTGPGLAFTVGGLAGLVAAVLGVSVQNRSSRKLLALGQEVQASGGAPTHDQLDQIQVLQGALGNAGLWTAILLVIATLSMSSARYLVF